MATTDFFEDNYYSLYAALFVLGVISWLVAKHYARKRTEVLSGLSEKLGFNFSETPARAIRGLFSRHKNFDIGIDRKIYNLMEKTIDDRPVYAFDYDYDTEHYSRHSGHYTITHTFSAAAVRLPCIFPRELYIRDERIFDKIAGVAGFGDLDFGPRKFHSKYLVKCSDKRLARRLIHRDMMRFLMRGRGYSYELEKNILCIRSGKKWKPRQFEPAIELAVEFVRLIPEEIIEKLQKLQSKKHRIRQSREAPGQMAKTLKRRRLRRRRKRG
ncbi:hypothetical protein ACFL54_07175 [Planctomycetota bacterium]